MRNVFGILIFGIATSEVMIVQDVCWASQLCSGSREMVVGYTESENLTPNQKFIAGVISGVTTRFISQPLDIIKVRTQLQSRTIDQKRNWLALTWHIFKEEGFFAFWHGHCLGQLHSVVSISAQFHIYELSTRFVEQHSSNQNFRPIFLFFCGVFAGGVSACLVSPLEVIRLRQMLVKAQYGGVWKGAATVYRNGGLMAFYEGLPASVMQVGPQVGIAFSVFRVCQPRILQYVVSRHEPVEGVVDQDKLTNKDLLITTTMAGSIAGFVSKTLTYPFDLAKRRLQIQSHKQDPTVETPTLSRNPIKCRSLVNCIQDMVQKDGFRGLFRGWTVTIYKAQWTSVVAFTSYEMMCHTLRNPRES